MKGPAPLPGSVLPKRRILAYYGNPHSKKMGVLGELAQPEMFAKLDRETAAWNRADPSTPVQQALHLIATIAQGDSGKDGKWRRRESPAMIEKVYGWAKQKNALMFLDVQIGKSTLEEELQVLLPYLQRPDVHLGLDPEFAMTKGGVPGRRVGTYDARHINHAIAVLGDLVTKHRLPPKVLVPYLQRPDVHLGIDPEFAMTKGGLPGKRVGTYDASHINYASGVLAGLVTQYKLPPKVLVVHRFTGPMVTNVMQVRPDSRVQVVIDMDGWGPPYGKRATWSRFIYPYPLQYTGFKLFYHNDTKAGHPLMKPKDVLALHPDPLYIQYQ